MRTVVSATEDLLLFILSEKGQRVQVFLLRDIIRAADIFLQDEVFGCSLTEEVDAKETLNSQVSLILSYQLIFYGLYALVEATKRNIYWLINYPIS